MKRKSCKYLVLACVLAMLLAVTAFAVPVPEEPTTPEPVTPTEPAIPEPTEPTPVLPDSLTPDGNLTLVDDIVQENKQFITLVSKNGNYFYLVVDRSGEEENVYFLNLVDEADLLALIEKEPTPEETTCICQEPCIGGTVNHDCPVCDVNTAGCQAETSESTKETEEPEEPVETDPVEPTDEGPEEPEAPPFPWTIVITVVILLALGTVYFLKFHKKPQVVPALESNEDEYEIPDEEEESETEENPEDALM